METSDFILACCAQGNRHKSAQCTLWHNGSLSSLDQKKTSNEFVISIEDPFSRSLEIGGPSAPPDFGRNKGKYVTLKGLVFTLNFPASMSELPTVLFSTYYYSVLSSNSAMA